MAIQIRRGAASDFDSTKMVSGELAVSTDGSHKVWATGAAGDCWELQSAEDSITDVKVNGTSVVEDGKANIPLANGTVPGASTNNYTTAEKTKLAGIQEGAAAVDSTLSVTGKAADAKKTGDEITHVKQDNLELENALSYASNVSDAVNVHDFTVNWGQGGINDDGTVQGTNYKIRTNMIDLSPGDVVALGDLKYNLQVFIYNADDTFNRKTSVSQMYAVDNATHCRIVVQRVNPIFTILPTEGSTVKFLHNANVEASGIPEINNKVAELYALSDLLALQEEYFFPASFYARGRYSGGYPLYDITYRAVMPDIVRLNYDVTITPTNTTTFKVSVLLYDGNGTFVSSSQLTAETTIPKNQGFRLDIRRVTESTSEIVDLYVFARAITISSANKASNKIGIPFADYKINAKLYKNGGVYESLVNPRDNCIRINNGVTVYMATNGSDANDGLSSASPKKTFSSALAVSNVQTILLAEGTYEAGTHFSNGEEVTRKINLIGMGDVIIKNGHFSSPITFKDSLYCENITFYWGNNTITVQYDSYDKVATFYKCRFEKSGVNNGLYALGGLTYVIECEASGNASDGFNYHKNGTILNHAIEIGCKSSFNGDGNNTSSNATTTHDGSYIVRVNGDYKCCYGGVVADQEAYSANYGCSAGISTISDNTYADKMSNYWSSSSVMYLYDCVSYGSKYDTAKVGTGQIISDTEYPSNYTE